MPDPLRERRPGTWELRVALGPHEVSGRSLVRSVTVHGDLDDAAAALARWAATAQTVRAGRRAAPGITLGDLLTRWLTAPHGWRPSTLAGYTSMVKALRADPLGHRRATALSPQVLRCAMAAWTSDGVGPPTVAGRVRCLRSALSWAYREGILDSPPLRGCADRPPDRPVCTPPSTPSGRSCAPPRTT